MLSEKNIQLTQPLKYEKTAYITYFYGVPNILFVFYSGSNSGSNGLLVFSRTVWSNQIWTVNVKQMLRQASDSVSEQASTFCRSSGYGKQHHSISVVPRNSGMLIMDLAAGHVNVTTWLWEWKLTSSQLSIRIWSNSQKKLFSTALLSTYFTIWLTLYYKVHPTCSVHSHHYTLPAFPSWSLVAQWFRPLIRPQCLLASVAWRAEDSRRPGFKSRSGREFFSSIGLVGMLWD